VSHSSPPCFRRPRQVGVLLVLLPAFAALPACDGGEAKPTVAQVEVSGKGKNVEVKAPKAVKDGLVELELRNTSDGPRDAQVIRVEGDHSPEEFLKVVESEGGPIPDWIRDGGGVPQTDPGQTSSATQSLQGGNYFVVSAPAGEGEPATAELKVESGGREGRLPEASAEIVASEYAFDVKGLKAGKNKVLFRNDGQELHHAVGAPLRPGKTLDDVRRFSEQMGGRGRPSGQPPIDERAGFSTAVIDGGVEQVIDLNVKKPGRYAVMCFIQDRRGGPPHVMKGMLKEVQVK
jgi:hypothetical protein